MGKQSQSELRAEYAVWTVYPERCAICWIPSRRLDLRFNSHLELAHIVSRGRGGRLADRVENVLFLCSSCHGSQHQVAYTYEGIIWPEIKISHLWRAKLEIGEMRLHELAEVSGYTPRYLLELTRVKWPEMITAERMRWGRA